MMKFVEVQTVVTHIRLTWIGIFLFKSPLAGNFILTLAWICPFLYTNTVLLSMINGLGKTTCSFLFNLFSLCIRITGVFLFIPAAGIRHSDKNAAVNHLYFIFHLKIGSK